MKNSLHIFLSLNWLLVTVIFLFSFISCSSDASPKETMKDGSTMEAGMTGGTNKSHELKVAMNKLWEDHVTWTRNVILCLVDGVPGTDQAIARLMQNQVDIGNAIKPYYGDAAGNALTELLKAHIAISADVVNAAKVGNEPALDIANKKWYANADEISTFLSNANENWPLADMKMMMQDHLKLTTDEAVQRIKKDYDADIKAYDKVHDEILKMAAMLSDGIIKQFPDKFN